MPTLVLLPGLAADATMWRDQINALADWQPVVSDVHMHHARVEDMAAELLRQHAGPLVLVGASMGGMLAMEALRQAPDRITAAALLGTNAGPETPEMRTVRENAIALFVQGRLEEVIAPNVHLAFHPAHAARLADTYLEFVLRAGAEQLIRQNRAVIARPDARLHLPQVRCPVLVMCGDADLLTPPDKSQEIARLVPGARLVMVPECGHMLTMEQPETVNAALREWLAAIA